MPDTIRRPGEQYCLSVSTARGVGRVETKVRFGPDSQVDDKALIIMPNDPARTDPFLALAEDWFSAPGFEWHPHRGIETVTLVVDGVLEHGDNLGNAGALEPGDVQWMTAGRGIIHRELAYRDEHAHTLQLWVNLPADRKLVDTRYQDLLAVRRPRIEAPGTRVDVVSGPYRGATGDVTGPALNHWPIHGALITLEPNTSVSYAVPDRHRAFAYVLTGTATIAGRPVQAGQIAWSDPAPGSLTFAAPDGDEVTTVMLYSGEPIGQPVVLGGPFVMNSREEIVRAYADFHAGHFGDIPRQARLKYR
jgi:redox-sensitive bicupin YhaK (pirin superfamily)